MRVKTEGYGIPVIADKAREDNQCVVRGQLINCAGDRLEVDGDDNIIIPAGGGSEFVYLENYHSVSLVDFTDLTDMYFDVEVGDYVFEGIIIYHVPYIAEGKSVNINFRLIDINGDAISGTIRGSWLNDAEGLPQYTGTTQSIATVDSAMTAQFGNAIVAENSDKHHIMRFYSIVNITTACRMQLQAKCVNAQTNPTGGTIFAKSYMKLTTNGCVVGGGSGVETDPVFTAWLNNYVDTSGMNASWRGAWAIPGGGEIFFYVNDIIIYNSKFYYCTTEHSNTHTVYEEPSDISAYWHYMFELTGGSGTLPDLPEGQIYVGDEGIPVPYDYIIVDDFGFKIYGDYVFIPTEGAPIATVTLEWSEGYNDYVYHIVTNYITLMIVIEGVYCIDDLNIMDLHTLSQSEHPMQPTAEEIYENGIHIASSEQRGNEDEYFNFIDLGETTQHPFPQWATFRMWDYDTTNFSDWCEPFLLQAFGGGDPE